MLAKGGGWGSLRETEESQVWWWRGIEFHCQAFSCTQGGEPQRAVNLFWFYNQML